ncbi:MAG: tRNA pseudouridine(55) synthase TruB [Candidatus Margulisiibacteriota bacterium]|nr:MAG: tRNA pseudouridine(55) synthase TruB [Candidatus Margulisbacteria bacterium GWD2_39_127]OGI01592.1 MAG: tRNA pseudouridine(55) synthase TruB [Candidatus Margulisbacteria bacterium GWF2_38_17]OGI10034.1 MAG: tRNA pseudouridine(55) synthase TruB [Candidatus Margulisbacteria bacterium GWE2_39_32]PZM78289.1 MAG: tRNA pseudouridine(55) synthase TruB [Candidatus Margulisiibacteriota bacterium]HAR62263.1 tRNA pseudouridine(55) synthase TruB [Candidatus Margulisiibacteriota bacterium]
MEEIQGIYNIWKPLGLTSHDVVKKIRWISKVKKVGHAGTLDPGAEGVLVVCIGREYTKTISSIANTTKEYVVGMTLGIITDSYDREGKVIKKESVAIADDRILEIVKKYKGEQEQIPPMFSAVHHNGKRLYELARQGIEVERAPRKITIHDIAVEKITPGDNPEVTMRVSCSSGTYIRTLCFDIGNDLGCGAFASFIIRTRVGNYNERDSITLEEFENAHKK